MRIQQQNPELDLEVEIDQTALPCSEVPAIFAICRFAWRVPLGTAQEALRSDQLWRPDTPAAFDE